MLDEQMVDDTVTPEEGATPEPETSEGANEATTETVAEAVTPAEETADVSEAEVVAAEPAVTAVLDNAVEAGAPTEREPHRKARTGLVVSDKMDKTITVLVRRRVRHPLYKKYFFKSKKYMAHDETNDCNIGDRVRIVETRPMSARKRWGLDEVLERAK